MTRGARLALALAFAAVSLGGCVHARRPAPAVDLPDAQVGVASYYGPQFEGRRTASGEKYCGDEFTAAHRTLAFGTKIRVTHAKNGRTVECVVNDRGPHKKGRIVDLSRRAAEALGMMREGLAKVTVEVLEEP